MTTSNLVNIDEAAAYLSLKPATLRSWVLRRKIPYVKVNGKAVRIRLSDLDTIIQEGSVPVRQTTR